MSYLKAYLGWIMLSFLLASTSVQAQSKDGTAQLNTLDTITLSFKRSGLKNQAFFKDNKKQLRKAARLSQGDIDKFERLVLTRIPELPSEIQYTWQELYEASRLLTFTGKIEALPSVL